MQIKSKRFIVAACGIVLISTAVAVFVMTSNPVGYYDLGKDARGGIFGGSTSTVRFYDGKVITVFAGSSVGTYFQTSNQWIWVMDTGRELRVRPGIMALECYDPLVPTNIVKFRRVLPSKIGTQMNESIFDEPTSELDEPINAAAKP